MHVNHIYRNYDETFIFHGNETTYFIMYTTWSEVKWNEKKCEKQHTQKIMWFPSEYKTNLKRIKRSHEPFGVKNKNNDPNYCWKWMPKLLRNEWHEWRYWLLMICRKHAISDNERQWIVAALLFRPEIYMFTFQLVCLTHSWQIFFNEKYDLNTKRTCGVAILFMVLWNRIFFLEYESWIHTLKEIF